MSWRPVFNDPAAVLALIKPTDRVLDVGGATSVFRRADAVIDIVGYEARTRPPDGERERFARENWHAGDVCSPEVWRHLRDKEFDFVVCSHLLEDVRDPLFVCSQLVRVGRAGYIEVPSRFRECAKVTAQDVIAGWEHHRWIVDVEDGALIFTMKNPLIHRFDFLGDARREFLHDPRHQFTAVHWVGSFDFVERSHKGSPWETENLALFYQSYGYDRPSPFHEIVRMPHRGRSFQWISAFRLPIEERISEHEILARYQARMRPFRATLGTRLRRRVGGRVRRMVTGVIRRLGKVNRGALGS